MRYCSMSLTSLSFPRMHMFEVAPAWFVGVMCVGVKKTFGGLRVRRSAEIVCVNAES